MAKKDVVDSTADFENRLRSASNEKYVLRLYVSGMTPKSIAAVENVKRVCEENFSGRYNLEVIDIRQHPELAKEAQVIASPTLVKKLPLPLRKVIGDMSKREQLLVGLDVVPKKAT